MAQENNNQTITFDENSLYYTIYNAHNKSGETIIYKPCNNIMYVYELNKLDNYNELHKAAKRVLSKNNEYLGGYDMRLYKICKGNIRLIKKLYTELKTIKYNNMNEEFEKLRDKYDVKEITNSHFRCMMNNPDFKIIEEFNEGDKEKEEQTKEFKKRCYNIEQILIHNKFLLESNYKRYYK